jgi:hypothetical protein
MSSQIAARDQRGAVLLVSLLVLMLIAIIANAVARTNLLQLHMAGNTEAKTAALQTSLALVDAALANASSTPASGGLGYKICAMGDPDASCDEATLSIDSSLLTGPGKVELSVSRVGPLVVQMPIMAEHKASSSQFYRAAKYEVRAGYDGTGQGQGRAVVVQGVLVRLAATAN